MANERSLSTIGRHSIRRLSDAQLAAKLDQLNTQKHAVDAELLLCLSELERRRLYREQACASLFEYCVTRLGQSEDVAYKRVGAARMMLEYPEIYELLANGHIHLTGLMLLKPHLTAANRQDWLTAASGKSKRQIEKLIATRLPQPDVPATIRRLPERKPHPAVENDPKGERTQGDLHSAPRDKLSPTASHATSTEAPAVTAVSAEAPESKPSRMTQSAALAAMAQSGPTQSGPTRSGPTQSGPTRSGPTQLDTMELDTMELDTMELDTMELEGADGSVAESGVAAQSGTTRSGMATIVGPNVKAASGVAQSSTIGSVTAPVACNTKAALGEAQSSVPNVKAASRVDPLSSQSYRVVFTASERLKQKLDRARELLSHAIAPNDLPAIIERALDQLIEREERRRYGGQPRRQGVKPELHAACQKHPADQTEAQDPDPNPGVTVKPRSRYVPAAVRREVWTRDGGQCTYVDRAGRRCEQRRFLELDHREAFAIGGSDTAENLRIRCRAHNVLEAEKLFGRDRIKSAIAHAQRDRAG